MAGKRINFNLDSMITGGFGLLMFFGIQFIWNEMTIFSILLGLATGTPFILFALHSIRMRTDSANKE